MTSKKKLLKPLTEFNYKIIGEQVKGLLINVDRDLHRMAGTSNHVDFLNNHAYLLNQFVRFATNSHETVLYFAGDIPEDPRRKENYVIAVPPINRQLLDLLFTMVYLLDDFAPRVRDYMRSGWREMFDERQLIRNTFPNDAQYKAHARNLVTMLGDLEKSLQFAEEEKQNPTSFRYWPHPFEISELQTKSRPFGTYCAWYIAPFRQ